MSVQPNKSQFVIHCVEWGGYVILDHVMFKAFDSYILAATAL